MGRPIVRNTLTHGVIYCGASYLKYTEKLLVTTTNCLSLTEQTRALLFAALIPGTQKV